MTVWFYSLVSVAAALAFAALVMAGLSRWRLRLLRDFVLFLLLAAPGVLLPLWLAVLGDGDELLPEGMLSVWGRAKVGPPFLWLSVVVGSYLLGLAALRACAFRPARAGNGTPGALLWWKRGLGWVGLVASGSWVVATTVLSGFAVVQLKDACSEAQDLMHACTALEEPDNAAPLYLEAHALVETDETGRWDVPYLLEDDEEETWEEEAREYLARYTEVSYLLHEAARYPGCQFEPLLPRSILHFTASLLLLADCAYFLKVEGQIALRDRDLGQALANVTALLGVARQKLETDALSFADFATGLHSFSIGIDLLEEALNQAGMAEERIVGYEVPPLLAIDTLRPLFLRSLALLQAGGLQDFCEAGAAYERAGPCRTLIYRLVLMPMDLEAFREVMPQFRSAAAKGHAVAVAAFGDGRPPWATSFTLFSASALRQAADLNGMVAAREAQQGLARTALAMHLFRAQARRFPERLEELVPEHMERVPVDPFDGEPLRLRLLPRGWRLYSVGPDRRDDGGEPSGSTRQRDDVVFTYSPP